MKIDLIAGTRPNFVKIAALIHSFPSHLEIRLIHTGQHYDKNLSDSFFEELELPKPDINLGVSGGDNGRQTGEMIIGLEKEIKRIHPTHIIIYGDTNSTLAGAIEIARAFI